MARVAKQLTITINPNLLDELRLIKKHNGTCVSTFLNVAALEKLRRERFFEVKKQRGFR